MQNTTAYSKGHDDGQYRGVTGVIEPYLIHQVSMALTEDVMPDKPSSLIATVDE